VGVVVGGVGVPVPGLPATGVEAPMPGLPPPPPQPDSVTSVAKAQANSREKRVGEAEVESYFMRPIIHPADSRKNNKL
jgi:hypothetical protein